MRRRDYTGSFVAAAVAVALFGGFVLGGFYVSLDRDAELRNAADEMASVLDTLLDIADEPVREGYADDGTRVGLYSEEVISQALADYDDAR